MRCSMLRRTRSFWLRWRIEQSGSTRFMTGVTDSNAPPKEKRRVSRLMLLQVALTLLAFTYLIYKSDVSTLVRTFQDAPLWGVPAQVLTLLTVMFAGAVRWRFLLAAYGAKSRPPLLRLFRL